jgi:hypothetical protein
MPFAQNCFVNLKNFHNTLLARAEGHKLKMILLLIPLEEEKNAH